jgi:type IV pilus assembly protein PilO
MKLEELNKLDFKTVADWPLGAKLGLLGILFALVVAGGWWFLWSPALESLDAGKAREDELKSTYVTKKGQAINLDAYKKQLADIQQSFGALLKQLPNRQEMDALVTDVNQAGLGRGLEFELFRPEAETKKEFYAELPIRIKVGGSYHDIAAFTSDVAKLSRIVTIHDISLVPARGSDLVMEAVAKTYRYLDEEEIVAGKPQKKEGKN